MSAAPRTARRRFLFLQGLPGFFFSRLGAALAAEATFSRTRTAGPPPSG